MRKLLRYKAVTLIAAIISFTAIPAGIVATATPALAAGNLCNTFGSYCAGGATINIGDPVVLTPTGRVFEEVAQNFKCCGGFEVYQLEFRSNTARCMGIPAGSINVTVRDCSGGNTTNVNWAREPQSDGSVKWLNTQQGGFLASNNVEGQQLFITGGCSGCFLKWNG